MNYLDGIPQAAIDYINANSKFSPMTNITVDIREIYKHEGPGPVFEQRKHEYIKRQIKRIEQRKKEDQQSRNTVISVGVVLAIALVGLIIKTEDVMLSIFAVGFGALSLGTLASLLNACWQDYKSNITLTGVAILFLFIALASVSSDDGCEVEYDPIAGTQTYCN